MIEVRNLTKSYVIGDSRHYVFENVSFSFPENTNIGILGPNGAGKSTLLRILGGIDFPDSGEIVTDASISWPLGLKGGFVPHMTGRENCRMICNAYSIPTSQIPERLESIKQLSGIGPYFDQPVAYYSSGMGGRLGFAMSMAFDFDYFLIDEVTAVGDGHFKKHAKEALTKKRATSNVIMVSHTMGDLKQFCDVAVLIKKGSVTIYEDWDEAIEAYLPRSTVKLSVDGLLNQSSKDEESRVNASARMLTRILPAFENANGVAGELVGNSAGDLLRISRSFARLGFKEPALEYALEAFKVDDFNLSIALQIVVLSRELGDVDSFSKGIEVGLKLDPNNAKLNLENARHLFAEGDYEGAIDCLKISLSVAPENFRAWQLLTESLIKIRSYREASKAASEGLKYKDDCLPLISLKSQSEFLLGNYDRALEYFMRLGESNEANRKLELSLQSLEEFSFSLSEYEQ